MKHPAAPRYTTDPLAPRPSAARKGGRRADGSWRRWIILTVLGSLSLAGAFGLLYVCWLLSRPLALLVAAIVIASAVEPLVRLLESRLPRALAVGLLYLGLVLLLISLASLAIPPVLSQTEQLISVAPELADQTQQMLQRWTPTEGTPQGLFSAVESWVAGAGSWLVSLPPMVVSSALELVLVLAMSAYWSISSPALRRFALSLAPPGREEFVAEILAETGRTVGGYIRATVINAAIVGLLVYAGLTIIGLEYSGVLGFVAAFGELIPYLGPFLAAVPSVAIAFLTSPTQALIVAAFYVVMQQLENHLLVPLVMRHETHIPPVLVVFSLAAGGTLGGVLGALIAVPVAGALRVLTLRVLVPALCHWTHGSADERPEPGSAKSSPRRQVIVGSSGEGHRYGGRSAAT